MNSFYSENELENLGFKNFGTNVLISRKTSIYNSSDISIGNNVRIDDYCILSGKISIGSYVHIAAFAALYGSDSGIYVEDFAGISSKVSVYAASDDYSGLSLTNPTVPEKYKHVISSPVYIKKHSIVGAHSVILPGVTLEEGTSIGSMSLVNKSTTAWTICAGIPCKFLKNRNKNLLIEEKKLLSEV